MKTSRKGFTLVELLIVVAILATLTATMMVSMNGATAKAKAATIASNVDACVTAVKKYYGDGLGVKYESHVNDVISQAIPRFGSFTEDGNTIKYTLADDPAEDKPDPTDYTKWTMEVDFSEDSEKEEIRRALMNIRGYDYAYTKNSTAGFTKGDAIIPTGDANNAYKFQVNLYNGTLSTVPVAVAP